MPVGRDALLQATTWMILDKAHMVVSSPTVSFTEAISMAYNQLLCWLHVVLHTLKTLSDANQK